MRMLSNKNVFGALLLTFSVCAQAHFQMLIPAHDVLKQSDDRKLKMQLMFWHPFEGLGMDMQMPVKFGVYVGGHPIDLLPQLVETKSKDIHGKSFRTFSAQYSIQQPGDHVFFVEPKPYLEISENTFIIHYTKVVVNGFGLEDAWDSELGLKAEMIPLTRPYGLVAGNVFQAVVKFKGKPAAGVPVEIEHFNKNKLVKVPVPQLITQIVKTDANGMFTYGIPREGWWGFAALSTDDKKMKHEDKEFPVELGAVMWLKAYPR